MLHSSDYSDRGVPLVNPTNIVDEDIVPDPSKLIDSATVSRLRGYVLRAGDVVVGRRGEIGRCAVVGSHADGWICGTGSFFVRPSPAIDPTFLAQLIRSDYYRSQLSEASTGTTMSSISNSVLGNLVLSIPDLQEQQRIVGILDEAFEGIATAKAHAERNVANARALFESYVDAKFTASDNAWRETTLGEVCDRVSVGHVGPTTEFYCDKESGIAFLRSQNVRRGRLSWEGIQHITRSFHAGLRKSQLQPGDVLFVRVGANRGDCCTVPDNIGELNCANIVFARPSKANSAFIERYCSSSRGRRHLLGMTTGSAQGVINTGSVAELPISLPSLAAQASVVDAIQEFEVESQRLQDSNQTKVALLDDLKNSLLHQAFTGQL